MQCCLQFNVVWPMRDRTKMIQFDLLVLFTNRSHSINLVVVPSHLSNMMHNIRFVRRI